MDENNANPPAGGPAPAAPAEQPAQAKCTKCGGGTSGYKCDMCDAESAEHDPNHACGADHCMPKCAGCSQAASKCSCQSATADQPAQPAV